MCLFFFFFTNGQQQDLTVSGFVFAQEELCWVGAGGLASGTLSLCPVQVHGHRDLAAPAGHGHYVVRLVAQPCGPLSLKVLKDVAARGAGGLFLKVNLCLLSWVLRPPWSQFIFLMPFMKIPGPGFVHRLVCREAIPQPLCRMLLNGPCAGTQHSMSDISLYLE